MNKYLFLLSVLLFSCGRELSTEVDEGVQLSFQQMEKLYEQEPDSLSPALMSERYGYFWEVYRQHIISLPNDERFHDSLIAFQQNEHYQEVYQKVQQRYADFTPYAQELTQAFQRYHYHFPERLLPKVVTFFGGFNYPVVATDSVLAIGLEMFLGKESKYYKALSQKYPVYMHQQFQPDYMTALAVKGWVETDFPLPRENFLSQMVHQGKQQYLLSQLLPDCADSVLMGYSKAQLEWCEASEAAIWQFFIEQDLLYSTDQMLLMKYMNPAPYTRGMPQESPGKVAAWVGWRIVQSFMEENPAFSLSDLMQHPEAQIILNKSKYKP
jgi:hypothetical protein